MTAEQQATADEFMKICDAEALEMARFSKEDPRDTVCRYLRSRKFLLEPGMKLLNECKALKIEGKAKEYSKMTAGVAGDVDVEIMKTFYPHTMSGHDKENRPILWEMTGQTNTFAIANMMTKELLLGYHFWTMETKLDSQFTEWSTLTPVAVSSSSAYTPPPLPTAKTSYEDAAGKTATEGEGETEIEEGGMFSDRHSQDGNNNGNGNDNDNSNSNKNAHPAYSSNPIATTCVMDLQGFGLANCTQKMMDQVQLYIKTDNICYPETLGKMLVINAPWIMNKIWVIIKGWLDPRTVTKIEIISGREQSIKRLHELISKEQLPQQYGGLAGELYFAKPNVEYQMLPRGGDYKFEITIKPGQSVVIDTYVSEIAIEYVVESRLHPNDSEKQETEKGGWGWGAKADDSAFASLAYMQTKTHKKCLLEPDSTGTGRLRHCQTVMSEELGNSVNEKKSVQVQVTWKNTARMSRYPVCFGVTPKD